MKITICTSRAKETFDVSPTTTIVDLKKMFRPSMDVNRKALKFLAAGSADNKAVVLDDKQTVLEAGLRDGSEVQFKDLGPQVGYRTVFVVEYAGPIAIMALYASQPAVIFGASSKAMGAVQKLYITLFLLHFVKRELETFFVHKFSNPTMPLMNIFKNSMYYWSFAAVIGYFLCTPSYTAPSYGLETIAAIAWAIFELGNLMVHLQLSGMRHGDGERTRNTPKGPLFALVTCPNYTFEFLSWAAFSVGSGLTSSWLFTLVGFAQMTAWALKKHRGYIKSDPAATKGKKSILPFLI